MTSFPCQNIATNLGQLFSCSEVNGFVRIRTPYLYPDGDVIDLFFKEQEGKGVLTDLGETLRWLDSQTSTKWLSKKQAQFLQDIQLTHGVESYQGMLIARVAEAESLAEVLTRLTQAVMSAADLWFLSRTRVPSLVSDEVAEFLEDQDIHFARNEKQLGRSGRSWRVDFHTWHPQQSSFVQLLSTGSRAAANTKVNSAVAAWSDLSHLLAGSSPLRFVSLFDDSADVWTPEVISQLEEFSEVAYWSRPDEFLELLVS